jgi:hypothetical protein
MLVVYNLGRAEGEDNFNLRSIEIFDKLNLAAPLMKVLRRLGRSESDLVRDIYMIRLMIRFGRGLLLKTSEEGTADLGANMGAFRDLVLDPDASELLNINEYQNIKYYSKENLEELIDWIYTINVMLAFREAGKEGVTSTLSQKIDSFYRIAKDFKKMSVSSRYELELLLEKLQK